MMLILKAVSWHFLAHYLLGTMLHTYTKLSTNSYLATSNSNEASTSIIIPILQTYWRIKQFWESKGKEVISRKGGTLIK